MEQNEKSSQFLMDAFRENAAMLQKLMNKAEEKKQDKNLMDHCIVVIQSDDYELPDGESSAEEISNKYYITNNKSYLNPIKISPKGICIYSSGTVKTAAELYENVFNVTYIGPSDNISVHALINYEDGKIYQTLPWDYKGRHQYSELDDSYLGIVICEANSCSLTNDPMVDTFNSLVVLVAWLCKVYDIPLSNENILLQTDSNELADIESYWQDFYSGSEFFARVKEEMESGISVEKLREYYAL
jgi:hypothetical protein